MSNKISDKNVANIEDDVTSQEAFNELIDNFEVVATLTMYGRKLIKHYVKKMKAEREQDKKRIQELEEERQLVGIPVRNKRDGKIGIVLHQWENGSIAVLERINPRIINTHDSWNTLEIITDEVKQVQTQDDTISKQVIIDKIKEVHNMKFEDDRLNGATIDFAVHKFEELLEGEGK